MSLRAEIFSFVLPENVARELFGFGAGAKKFSRHNEKILAPLFRKTRATIGAFLVRISEAVSCRLSNNGEALTPPSYRLGQQTSTTSPHIALASD
ncbi:hypothetical protein CLI73_03880 [Porphyromonas gingivalis]|nr:hypothetical protein [Porphyromonas gingivalis]PDP79418.1 hypothetical protein CLI73_03880 [Porphyromonas gingivalis]